VRGSWVESNMSSFAVTVTCAMDWQSALYRSTCSEFEWMGLRALSLLRE